MAARSRVVFSEQNFTNLRNVLMQRKSRIRNSNESREAAVLVPLCVQQNEPHILFTKRSFKMRHHKGQISFPGGICDEGESPIDAALRETWEELGINRDQVDVLGMLTPLPDRVGTTLITPVVGRLTLHNILDHVITNPDEVSYAFTVSLSELMNKNNQRFTRFKRVPLQFPVFLCGSEPIWGLTGFILDVVINVLEQTMVK